MEQTIGKRIMHCRKNLGLTQDQLAEKLGVTAQAVSKWENDLSCPDIAMLPKLAAIFGTTTDALLGSTPEEIPLREAEVVHDQDDDGDLHIQKGNWDFKWDGGRRHYLCFALLVLAVGAQLLIARALQYDISFWNALWPTALTVYGFTGLLSGFSCFRLGAFLFGAYFLLDKWALLPFSLGGELVFPAILVIFGLSLLVDAMKKPKKSSFHFSHNGKKRNDYRVDGQHLEYSASFGDAEQVISMPRLASGRINTSFGDYDIDLSEVEEVTEDCCLDISCSFGDLDILVPRRFAVKQTTSTAFADFDISGHPDSEPAGSIRMKISVSFGDVTVRYV